ncbi:MAG TPA: YqgE/AlgH family protein [Solirubrobacteraceae bacterium]|jgi:putative transcriptional regulator|nr:YqgE/AlgH family protein [Solirubrobacteraceae bacterium]
MGESLAGQLLLASPALQDPNFMRTVVLVSLHSDEGAMGLVLNRPSAVTVGEAVPQLEQAVSDAEHVYVGGPVQPTSVVFLVEFLDPAPAGLLVVGRIGFPAPNAAIEELLEATGRGRVFAGYAGWGEGQLDAEIAQGDWIAHTALPEDVFTDVPEDLWSAVLTRKGGSYALIARMPPDPSVN